MTGCVQQTKVAEPKKTSQEAPKAVEERIAFDFPKDYKNWSHGTSKIILDKGSPLYGFQQVFVNDVAIDSYKKGGSYPDGSTIVIGFYEAIEEGHEIKQGNIIWYAAKERPFHREILSGMPP